MNNIQKIKSALNRIQAMPKPISQKEQINTTIKSVKLNGYIELSGIVYHVTNFYCYKETWKNESSEWYELMLVSLLTGEEIFLEWEEDDSIDLFVYEHKRKLRLNDISVSLNELDQMDDDEEGNITFKNQIFYYDDSNDATLFKNKEPGEEFYYWDFFSDDEDQVVGVEKWKTGSVEVSHGTRVETKDIKILVKGKE